MKRRDLLRGSLGGMLVFGTGGAALAQSEKELEAAPGDMIPGEGPREFTHDPDQPVLGNPEGDVTIIGFYDYQCPFCRAAHPALMEMVRADGNLRLVMKDWPIFGEISVRGVQLGLGAVALGQYPVVNEALMSGSGRRMDASRMDEAVRAVGVDPEAAIASFERERDKWIALVERNMMQADYLQLTGTPSWLVGLNLFPRVVEMDELRAAVEAIRRG